MSGRQSRQNETSRPINPMSITAMLNEMNNEEAGERYSRTIHPSPQARWSDQTHWQARRDSDQGSMDDPGITYADAGREKRDSYNEEQKNFIYYHRLVLGRSWERIEKDFWDHFGQRRSKSGLQCRFYRVLSERGSGKVRDQGRTEKHYTLGHQGASSGMSHTSTPYRG